MLFLKMNLILLNFYFAQVIYQKALVKTAKRLKFTKRLKRKYPKTEKGFSIDKYIYRLSVEKNDFSVK